MRSLLLASCTLFGIVVISGCGAKTVTTHDAITVDAADQFRKIAAAYKQASAKNRGAVSADDIKQALKSQGDVDKLLISPRDGKPVVIVSGVGNAKNDEDPIIAYEQTGADGKRMTVDTRGTIVLMTDSEFGQLKFAGGHRPSP